MLDPAPEAIVAHLDATQRSLVLQVPTSFAEADLLPEGLFEHELSWDRDTGDESHFWTETDLGSVADCLR